MKKKNKRWYEKDQYLRAFMTLLESVDKKTQSDIAVEIILKASNIIERKFNNILKDILEYDPKDHKRWYDSNPSINLAVETLKDLSSEEREQIILELSQELLKSHPSKGELK